MNGRVYEEAYQGPAVNTSGMSIPELADAEGSTCYVPAAMNKPGEIVWHLRSLQHAKALTVYQDGGRATDAIVSVKALQSPSEGAIDDDQWEELGALSSYVSRFDLTSYPLAVAVKISWTSKAPLIYEISEETDAETNTITGIERNEALSMKEEESDDGAIYDLSGRYISAGANSSFLTLHSSLKKGIYIHNGKKIIVR